MKISSQVFDDFGYSPYSFAILAIPKSSALNVLELDNLLEFADIILDYVMETETADNVSTSEVCLKALPNDDEYCAMHSILNHWGYERNVLENSVTQDDVYEKVSEEEQHGWYSEVLDPNLYMGGAVWESDEVVSATTLTFIILLNADSWYGPTDDGTKWELALMDRLEGLADVYPDSSYEFYGSGIVSIEKGVDDMIIQVYYGLAVGVLVCSVYNIIIFSDVFRKRDPVRSQLSLLVYATLSVGLSTISAIGVMGWLGAPWSYELPLCVFLCVSIGFDDAYLITFDFNRYDPKLGNRERIARTMRVCGTTITLTSATDVTAFMVGTGFGQMVSFPVMTNLCYYGAMCIFFLWIYIVTFFCALLSLDARRQTANRYDLLCCFRRKIKASKKVAVTFGGQSMTASDHKRSQKKVLRRRDDNSRPQRRSKRSEPDNSHRTRRGSGSTQSTVELNRMSPKPRKHVGKKQSVSVIDLEQISEAEDDGVSSVMLRFESSESGPDGAEKYKLSPLNEGSSRSRLCPCCHYAPSSDPVLTNSSAPTPAPLIPAMEAKGKDFDINGGNDLADDKAARNDCVGNLLGKVVSTVLRIRQIHACTTLIFFFFGIFCIFSLADGKHMLGFELSQVLVDGTTSAVFDYEYNERIESPYFRTTSTVQARAKTSFNSSYDDWELLREEVYALGGVSKVYGWPYEFQEYMDSYSWMDPTTEDEWYGYLNTWLSFKTIWVKDVLFNENGTIEVSRIHIHFLTNGITEAAFGYTHLAGLCDDLGWCYTFTIGDAFLEGLLSVREIVWITSALSCLAVFLVIYATLGDLFWSLFLSFVIGLVAIDFLGFTYVCGLYDDLFKQLGVAMAFGFTVDFNLHLVHRFILLENRKIGRDRVVSSISQVGGATFNGGFSTMLIVFPVALCGLSVNGIQERGALTFFIIIVLGLSHSLIFVPCLLLYVDALKQFSSSGETKVERRKFVGGEDEDLSQYTRRLSSL